jgi:hypothetical protein
VRPGHRILERNRNSGYRNTHRHVAGPPAADRECAVPRGPADQRARTMGSSSIMTLGKTFARRRCSCPPPCYRRRCARYLMSGGLSTSPRRFPFIPLRFVSLLHTLLDTLGIGRLLTSTLLVHFISSYLGAIAGSVLAKAIYFVPTSLETVTPEVRTVRPRGWLL